MKHIIKLLPLTIVVALFSCSNNVPTSKKAGIIRVSSVSLNYSSYSMYESDELQLSYTISPSNASNKEVTWSISDNSYASVDNSGYITALKEGSVTVTATTIDGGYTATCELNIETRPNGQTVLLYLCGSDLESTSYLATADIKEILSVSGQPEDVNIVIQTGGSNRWSSKYGISNKKLERYHVRDQQLIKDEILADASMGDSSTLQSFIEYGLTNYPAGKTGLILWNHGGAMQGVCFDERHNYDSLLTDEVASAVSNALTNTNFSHKLEWIGYDACMMQVQDIATINSEYFNYMIGSQEAESGAGWDYDSWLDDLYAYKPTVEVLKSIVDGFIADNGGADRSTYYGYPADQTLSVLNLNRISAYIKAWNNLSSSLLEKVSSSNRSMFNLLVKSSKTFCTDDLSYGIFDARDFLNKLSTNKTFTIDVNLIDDVINAFNDLVSYNVAQKGAGNAFGLSMFWSSRSNCNKNAYYQANMTKLDVWRDLVMSFGY